MEFGKVTEDAASVVVAVVVVVVVSAPTCAAASPLGAAADEAFEDFRDFFFVDAALEQLLRLLLRRGGSGEATCSVGRAATEG